MDIASLKGEWPSAASFFAPTQGVRRRWRSCVDSRSTGERWFLMRRIRNTLILVVAATVLLVLPAIATASPVQVIRDCAKDGKLDQHYSLSDLKKAEKKLPTDVDEYTNCRDVINQAEVQGSSSSGHSHGPASGGGGSGGGGGGSSASPKDVTALNHAKDAGNAPSL